MIIYLVQYNSYYMWNSKFQIGSVLIILSYMSLSDLKSLHMTFQGPDTASETFKNWNAKKLKGQNKDSLLLYLIT